MRNINGILILEYAHDYNADDVIYNCVNTNGSRTIRLKNIGAITFPCDADYPLYFKEDSYYDPHFCRTYHTIESAKAKEILAAYALELRKKAHEIEELIGN